jgi:hypothetical protein
MIAMRKLILLAATTALVATTIPVAAVGKPEPVRFPFPSSDHRLVWIDVMVPAH